VRRLLLDRRDEGVDAAGVQRYAARLGNAVVAGPATTALARSQGLVMIVPIGVLLAPRIEVRNAARALVSAIGARDGALPWTLRKAAVMASLAARPAGRAGRHQRP